MDTFSLFCLFQSGVLTDTYTAVRQTTSSFSMNFYLSRLHLPIDHRISPRLQHPKAQHFFSPTAGLLHCTVQKCYHPSSPNRISPKIVQWFLLEVRSIHLHLCRPNHLIKSQLTLHHPTFRHFQ